VILLTFLALEAVNMLEITVIFSGKAFQRLLLQILHPHGAKVAVRSREIVQGWAVHKQGDG
jgi:hypothetical protein